MKRVLQRALMSLSATAVAGTLVMFGLDRLDRAYPPPLDPAETSVEIVDRDGALLRALATREGAWRFRVALDDIDPHFVSMLIAYEDKRFYEHGGVDLLAIARAAWQLVTNGRIVSGGSTLSMQLARLLEPRQQRSYTAKLRQMVRAVQVERRLSKKEILERYLTLAPYGGNLEGIRAATLAWFGKEPKRLSVGEAALLVALPQLPERRRPDRNPKGAEAAKDRVLRRMASAGAIDPTEIARGLHDRAPRQRQPIPFLAAHAAERILRENPGTERHQLTLSRRAQEGLERVARDAAERLGPNISVAILMADAQTGDVLAEVGSANYFDDRRRGWIDMTRAVRSPGSTLKPFIYGLAFEEGMVAQETIIEDRPSSFGAYRPRNFDMEYQGDVSVRTALQMSLNVPAVRLLDTVGPTRLTSRFRQIGVSPVLPRDEAPGLAIALGGAGLTLRDLVQLYTGVANRGLATSISNQTGVRHTATLLDHRANWQIADILSGIQPPEGATRLGIGYKTGTSYGYRDAWSVGFDGRRVIGVWVGRPDGAPVPGLAGYQSAAPILFEAFARSSFPIAALPRPPSGTSRTARSELPVTLKRYSSGKESIEEKGIAEPAPEIVFPPSGARVDLVSAGNEILPLVLKLQGGRAPFRWLANGKPLDTPSRRRTSRWEPDSVGFSRLTVIDAVGRSASVEIYVE
ncbi:penicillin-binding protein 1C [Aquamicrobium zhengzhouense]|uniref:peptidoglycan glycosyltransferase n=1 Tax=Aquamicrobium zhengzhouense TaxID=2781738 RepID=A0ABS0S6Z5_9HYPH|nr:penicillin-binding protein 1C [Aquamicrobium zhengzhouense]